MADFFSYTSDRGERLDLSDVLVSWTGSAPTGVVEKLVVKRIGAIHLRVGAPPRKFEFHCVATKDRLQTLGSNLTARWRRLREVILQEPEGEVVHPRDGAFHAVVELITDTENPGDEVETINFTLKVSESGLREAPKPSPSAKAAAAAAAGASVSTQTASSSSGTVAAGLAFATSCSGFLVAMQAAETGLGTLLDADASLTAVSTALNSLALTTDSPREAIRSAYIALGEAIEARNAFMAGHPPLKFITLTETVGLSAFCRDKFASSIFTTPAAARAEILRLNRIAKPHAMPAGLRLLMSDPGAV